MRIAVIGAGIAGLVCARKLGRRHEVVLFEAEARAGGHTNTVMAGSIAIDTGFIVFNLRTYPRFTALLRELGVAWAPSEMTFSVRSERRDFEYAGTTLSTLYTQRRRLCQPRHHRLILDIFRFFRDGRSLLDAGAGDEIPLGDWLRARGYSRAFAEDHLYPMVRAVWSADAETAERFPARFLARFFDNHGFLQARDRVPWLTIPGGAQTYVRAILAELRGEVRLGTPVGRVSRVPGGARVDGERFDHVIFACHADQALLLLDDPSPLERELLGVFPFRHNDAILHTDARVMPRTRRAWSSWNVHLDGDARGPCLTYWMNRLQPLAAARDYFVSLNHEGAIDPAHVLGKFHYAHPVFTRAGVEAQGRHAELCDHLSTSYCGAYWRNGFHEDGVVTAERVCAKLGVA